VHARQLDGNELERADDPSVPFRDEVADLLLREVLQELGAQLVPALLREAPREHGRLRLVVGEEGVEVDEGVDVRFSGEPHARGPAPLGHRLDACSVLLAEADAGPGVDERAIGRGHERVVPRSLVLVDPPPCGGRVQVAQVLGFFDRMPGELDPDVRAPALVLADAEQVADEASVPERDRARGAVEGEQSLDLAARRLGILVPLRQQRLGRPVRTVPGGEQLSGGRQELVGKWANLEAGHRRETIASRVCPRR
jgi:hypothetical protein